MGTRIDLVNSTPTTLRTNDDTADSDGNIWWVREIRGWGSKAPDVRLVKRMATDGSVITNATYASRSITVAGIVVIASGSDWWEAMQMFENITDAVSADGKVIVYEPAGTRHALVWLRQQPQIGFVRGSPSTLSWSVTYIAANPDLQAGI
jgi:hypothetical protein